ncbi:hypothetical protein Pmani_002190 [Petrolisthes manimaculis]|uniref:Uncharacterized protein n=1 Tax=Petrolisthes manimaculis TaxID=1843537 RepID=A0AAE1UKN7_9EUCA|nr:hypothetical protein Pmani_002190 [Petrolisthes manimaculis]
MPLWLFTLGRRLLHENDDLQVPFGNLVASLISLTIPVAIGVLIRIKRPAWADMGGRFIKPFTLIIILIFMTLGVYNSYKVFTMMTWEMAVAGLMVSVVGYSVGALLAKLMCLGKPQIVAVSIETAFQNAGVTFMLLKLSLPSPDSDLAALPVMAAMMLTGPPLIILYVIFIILNRLFGWCPESQSTHRRLPQEEQEEEKETKSPPSLENETNMISGVSYMPASPSLEKYPEGNTSNHYGIILNGFTKKKLLEGDERILDP